MVCEGSRLLEDGKLSSAEGGIDNIASNASDIGVGLGVHNVVLNVKAFNFR
jgi:hypothetical protein